MTDLHYFADVTLLVTHYNRSRSLERLLAGFERLNCTFADIVVSDDGSRTEHLNALRTLAGRYGFRLVTTPANRGLGHNSNKGQDAVLTAYTLYVQEDFVPKPAFAARFGEALALMNQNASLDIVRLYAYFHYPYQQPYAPGFTEMTFRPMLWYTNHLKFYAYSDHPHLRRHSFFARFGRYVEGENGDKTEFTMCLSFLKNRGKGLFLTEFVQLFEQDNPADEPSTATHRLGWKYGNPVFMYLRKGYLVYRFLKNSLELALFRHHQPIRPVTGEPEPMVPTCGAGTKIDR